MDGRLLEKYPTTVYFGPFGGHFVPKKDAIAEQQLMSAAQLIRDQLASKRLLISLKFHLKSKRIALHNGWLVEIGRLPNSVSFGISLDYSLGEEERNLWFGFFSGEKGKIKYLEGILPPAFLPALQVDDEFEWQGNRKLLATAVKELYTEREDGISYLGKYIPLDGPSLAKFHASDASTFFADVISEAVAPPQLQTASAITNERLKRLFAVGNMGGMRRSTLKNLLVIVSDHTKNLYEDRWEGSVLHYTGMGKFGGQEVDNQNRTLAESRANGVAVYLFEVFKKNEYIYRGQVSLAGDPYQERQEDEDGALRNVWMFPVQVNAESLYPVSLARLRALQTAKERSIAKRSISDLKKAAKRASATASKRQAISECFVRNPYVAEYVKKAANGQCDLCEQAAPFLKLNVPFFHCHHVVWLSRGGPDIIQNAVALCPNCHERMHQLDRDDDIRKLSVKINVRDPDLQSLDHIGLTMIKRAMAE